MKVYLAKSYEAHPDTIIKFNNYIKDYDVSVKSYSGKKPYNHAYEFKDVIAMFVISPQSNGDLIGKGLYGQIQYALDKNINVFKITDNFKFVKIIGVNLNNPDNWTISYGKCQIEEGFISLLDYFPINMKERDILF